MINILPVAGVFFLSLLSFLALTRWAKSDTKKDHWLLIEIPIAIMLAIASIPILVPIALANYETIISSLKKRK